MARDHLYISSRKIIFIKIENDIGASNLASRHCLMINKLFDKYCTNSKPTIIDILSHGLVLAYINNTIREMAAAGVIMIEKTGINRKNITKVLTIVGTEFERTMRIP